MSRATTTRNSWLLEGLVVVLVGSMVFGAYQLGLVYSQLKSIKIELQKQSSKQSSFFKPTAMQPTAIQPIVTPSTVSTQCKGEVRVMKVFVKSRPKKFKKKRVYPYRGYLVRPQPR